MALSSFILWENMNQAKEVFVSYCIRDKNWVDTLLEFFRDKSFNIQLECLNDSGLETVDKDHLEIPDNLVPCFIILSEYYYTHFNAKLNRYLDHYRKQRNTTADLKTLLDSGRILVINLDGIFNIDNVKMLNWPRGTEREQHLFWKKLEKYIYSLLKRNSIKSILSQQVQHLNRIKEQNEKNEKDFNKEKEALGGTVSGESDSNMEKLPDDEMLETSRKETFFSSAYDPNDVRYSYKHFDHVYPHLLSDSFNAADEDLSKDDVENLTLKMEDIETIMMLNTPEKPSMSKEKSKNKIKNYEKFSTIHEQMEILGVLQEFHQKLLLKIQNEKHGPKKNSYKRLLRRYDEAIYLTLNGNKDTLELQELPFLRDVLQNENTFCKCCCCDKFFHSSRALQIHIPSCVSSAWKDLLHR